MALQVLDLAAVVGLDLSESLLHWVVVDGQAIRVEATAQRRRRWRLTQPQLTALKHTATSHSPETHSHISQP